MFCPMCKFEYRVEISRCEPCNVALVEQIPDEDPYSSTDGMARLLEGKDLQPLIIGDHQGLQEVQQALATHRVASIIGNDPRDEGLGTHVGSFCLLVTTDQVEMAQTVLRDNWMESVDREGLGTTPDLSEVLSCPACGFSVPSEIEECPECGLFVGTADGAG